MLNKKTFVLALGLIIVPLLVLWVLNLGKQNYNSLPYIGERIPPDGTEVLDTIYYQVPPFSFIDQQGKPFTQQEFDNYVYVANFFFASCKDVCPAMNAKVATVYEKMKEFSEVKFLSITVDPDNDSVPVLANYAAKLKADPAIWKFGVGPYESVYNAGQGFLLPVSKEDKTIDHSQQLILVDKDRHIRGMYDGLDDTEIKRLKEDIKVLLYEYSQKRSKRNG
jgi:protein SCO1/2